MVLFIYFIFLKRTIKGYGSATIGSEEEFEDTKGR